MRVNLVFSRGLLGLCAFVLLSACSDGSGTGVNSPDASESEDPYDRFFQGQNTSGVPEPGAGDESSEQGESGGNPVTEVGAEDQLGECSDGFDNDGDGAADCDDSGCSWVPNCQQGGAEGIGPEALEGDEAGECSDGVDNDQDGLFDCNDSGCTGSPFCESQGSGGGSEDTYEGDEPGECSDGADNDQDGAFDCNDSGCAGSTACASGGAEGGDVDPYEGDDAGECSDGADNDQDGLFDCQDTGCAGSAACASSGEEGGEEEGGGSGGGVTPENTASACSDGEDNDQDGDVDCDDSNCADSGVCAGSGPSDGTSCEAMASISCGDSVEGDTGEIGWSNIKTYDCPNSEYSSSAKSTWQELGPEVAYLFTPNADVLATADMLVPGFHELDVWILEGECDSSQCVATPTNITDEAIWEAKAGTTYYIVVDGFSSWDGPYELDLLCEPMP